jgi:hypothetical protein
MGSEEQGFVPGADPMAAPLPDTEPATPTPVEAASPPTPQEPPAPTVAWAPVAGSAAPDWGQAAAALQWTPPPPFEPAPPIFPDVPAGAAQFPPMPQQYAYGYMQPKPAARFKNSRTLAVAAQILIGLSGLLALVTAIHNLMGVEIQGRLNTARALATEADSFNSAMQTLSGLAVLMLIVSAIAFLWWLRRSLINSTVLGTEVSTVGTPLTAIVSWFIPLANLLMPYKFVQDLHDRLLRPLESKSGKWLLRLWWLFWLAGDIAGWVLASMASSIHADSTANRLPVVAGEALSSGLLFADAILAIAVIRQIQRLSDARQVAREGDPNRAIELVAQSQRARVTRLPLALAALAIVALIVPLGATYANASVAPSWVQFEPSDHSFTVLLPVQPLEKKIPMHNSGNFSLSGDSFSAGPGSDLAFAITYYDYPAGSLTGIGTAQAYAGMDKALPTTLTISSTSEIVISGRPAHQVRASNNKFVVLARYVINGDRVYVIEADAGPGQQNSPDIARFMDSFTLK